MIFPEKFQQGKILWIVLDFIKKDKRILCGECEEPYEMDYWDLTDIDNPEILDDRNDGLALTDEGWYGAILNS